MSDRIPPLETLRFFEVASRHLNFTRAAEELCVTHGAVSQRIKTLEEHIGFPLFERSGRKMVLTETGQELFARIGAALDDIERAVNLARGDELDHTLTVSVLPIFATRWLIPRLSRFNHIHPEINVNIRAGQALTDFDRDRVDLAIRFGSGKWPGLHSELLFGDELFPVCSPGLVKRPPESPSDLLELPLLHDERQPWSVWFGSLSIAIEDALVGPIYSDANLLLEAALAGHGVALARASFVRNDILSGRLIRLFDHSAKMKSSHYVVYPPRIAGRKKIVKFKTWLFREVEMIGAAADTSIDAGSPIS